MDTGANGNNMTIDFDVVVVGCGPTGLAAASLLARLGHTVAAFERHPRLYGLPRLCTMDGESARIIQTAGDVDKAFRISSWCRRYDLVDGSGELIVAQDFSDRHICGYPGRMSFYQPHVEEAMEAAARERGAEVNLGWELESLDDDGDAITVTVRFRPEDEEDTQSLQRTLRTRYVIGCDGANSTVRELIGISREDFGYRAAFLGIDCEKVGELPEQLRQGVAIGVCEPGHHHGFVPIGNDRMRFEFSVSTDGDHNELLNRDMAYELLAKNWGLTPDQVRVYRHVIYPFEGKLARTWHKGNVFLAGDAAHLMPPHMGQGACSGLRDAINLAWKMHLVLDDIAPPTLLDTYEVERIPHVRVHIEGSIALAQVTGESDPELAEARNAAYRSGNIPPPPADPTLLAGVLHRDENDQLSTYAGHLMEQGFVRYHGTTGRFDDLVGWGFHLLGYEFDPAEFLNYEQKKFLDSIGCKTVRITNDPDVDGVLDLDRTYEAFFKDRGMIQAMLVRPDFYIFATTNAHEDIPAMVEGLSLQLGAKVVEMF